MTLHIRPARQEDKGEIQKLVKMFWGEPYVVAQGTLHDTRQPGALIAVEQQETWGILHYRINQITCEIITLASSNPGRGLAPR